MNVAAFFTETRHAVNETATADNGTETGSRRRTGPKPQVPQLEMKEAGATGPVLGISRGQISEINTGIPWAVPRERREAGKGNWESSFAVKL